MQSDIILITSRNTHMLIYIGKIYLINIIHNDNNDSSYHLMRYYNILNATFNSLYKLFN